MPARENVGFIKLHRSILTHWLWPATRKYTELEAWLYLLLMTSYHNSPVFLRGQQYEVSRGQILISKRTLARRWGWTVNRVRNFLTMLERDQMIVSKTDSIPHGMNQISQFTIVNYDRFQSPNGFAEGFTVPITGTTTDSLTEPTTNCTTEPTTNPLRSKKKRKKERKNIYVPGTTDLTPEVLADTQLVIEEYCNRVKPERRSLHRGRAARSIARVLQEGTSVADLLAAVRTYAARDMKEDPEYRYVLTNFFGKSKYYADYLPDGFGSGSGSPSAPVTESNDGLSETDRILIREMEEEEQRRQAAGLAGID